MLTADRVGGALVLLKAVDVAVRGPVELPGALWAGVLSLWAAAGLALLMGRGGLAGGRIAWGVVLLAGAGLAADYPLELRRQHLVLLMGVALAAAVARDVDERLLLWRWQISTLYGIATLAKLNESFLGGDVLARAVVAAPLWSAVLPPPPTLLLLAAGIGLVASEAALAVTPWVRRLRRPGTVLAVCLHGVALVVSPEPLVALRLVVFGGTLILLHAASAQLVPAATGPSLSAMSPTASTPPRSAPPRPTLRRSAAEPAGAPPTSRAGEG